VTQIIAEDVYPGGVLQHKVRFAAACGDFQDVFLPAQIHVHPCGDIIHFHPASLRLTAVREAQPYSSVLIRIACICP
jgi:hypothetical protein